MPLDLCEENASGFGSHYYAPLPEDRRHHIEELGRAPSFMVTHAYLDHFCPHWQRPSAVQKALRDTKHVGNYLTRLASRVARQAAPFLPRWSGALLLSGSHAREAYDVFIRASLRDSGRDIATPPDIFLRDQKFHDAAKKYICNVRLETMEMRKLEALARAASPVRAAEQAMHEEQQLQRQLISVTSCRL